MKKTPPLHSINYRFVSKRVVSEHTGLSGDTLKRYRLDGKLQEGIHWVTVNPRVVRYNLVLVMDWLQNQNSDLKAHQQAIEHYLDSLSSHRSTKRSRL